MVRKPEVQFKQQEGGKLYMSELRAGAGSKRPVFVIPDPLPPNKRVHTNSKPVQSIPPPPAGEHKEATHPVQLANRTPPTLCGRWVNGVREKITCCGSKPHNLSEVQLIDESTGKKRGSTLTSQSMASTLQQQSAENPSAFRKMCCFCRPNYGLENPVGENITGTNRQNLLMEKKPWWRSACCSGGNKIHDSSATIMSGTATPAWKTPFACCCGKAYEEKRRREWADRRDSILSQPPPTQWWRRICCCGASGAAAAAASRRTSLFSKKRSLSQAVPLEDKRPKLDPSLVEHSSHLRGAIPALPVPLAWFCFVCNLLIPGLGTICSGLFCLCFGRPRFGVYDGYRQRIGAFVIDVIVGIGQLFTVLFCLVGWGWSIWWATIMLKVARKYRKLKQTAAEAERNGIPATTNNHRMHPA